MRLTRAMVTDFETCGWLTCRRFFDEETIDGLARAGESPDARASSIRLRDSQGKPVRLDMTNTRAEWLRRFGTSAVVIDAVEQLLGGRAFEFGSRWVSKRPDEGRWEWHQDYRFWHEVGCMIPNGLSVMIPLTNTTRRNGCLQVMTGSHLFGRLDHVSTASGEQYHVPKDRLASARRLARTAFLELRRGDVAFFHVNLLHASSVNKTRSARDALFLSYTDIQNVESLRHSPAGRVWLRRSMSNARELSA